MNCATRDSPIPTNSKLTCSYTKDKNHTTAKSVRCGSDADIISPSTSARRVKTREHFLTPLQTFLPQRPINVSANREKLGASSAWLDSLWPLSLPPVVWTRSSQVQNKRTQKTCPWVLGVGWGGTGVTVGVTLVSANHLVQVEGHEVPLDLIVIPCPATSTPSITVTKIELALQTVARVSTGRMTQTNIYPRPKGER